MKYQFHAASEFLGNLNCCNDASGPSPFQEMLPTPERGAEVATVKYHIFINNVALSPRTGMVYYSKRKESGRRSNYVNTGALRIGPLRVTIKP